MNISSDILSGTLHEQLATLHFYYNSTEKLERLTSNESEKITKLALSILGKAEVDASTPEEIDFTKDVLNRVFQWETSGVTGWLSRKILGTTPRSVPSQKVPDTLLQAQRDHKTRSTELSGIRDNIQSQLFGALSSIRQTNFWKEQKGQWRFFGNLADKIDGLSTKILSASSLTELHQELEQLCNLLENSKEKNPAAQQLLQIARDQKAKIENVFSKLEEAAGELPREYEALLALLAPRNTLGRYLGSWSKENRFLSRAKELFLQSSSPDDLLVALKGDPQAAEGTPEHLGVYGLIHKSLNQGNAYRSHDLSWIVHLEAAMANLEKIIENQQSFQHAIENAPSQEQTKEWMDMTCSKLLEAATSCGLKVQPKRTDQSYEEWVNQVSELTRQSPGTPFPQIDELVERIKSGLTMREERLDLKEAAKGVMSTLKDAGLTPDSPPGPMSTVLSTGLDLRIRDAIYHVAREDWVLYSREKIEKTMNHLANFLTAKSHSGKFISGLTSPQSFSLPLEDDQREQLAKDLIKLRMHLRDVLVSEILFTQDPGPDRDEAILEEAKALSNYSRKVLQAIRPQISPDLTKSRHKIKR